MSNSAAKEQIDCCFLASIEKDIVAAVVVVVVVEVAVVEIIVVVVVVGAV